MICVYEIKFEFFFSTIMRVHITNNKFTVNEIWKMKNITLINIFENWGFKKEDKYMVQKVKEKKSELQC